MEQRGRGRGNQVALEPGLVCLAGGRAEVRVRNQIPVCGLGLLGSQTGFLSQKEPYFLF